jgi:putative peptide zinc metalloprotease protein
VTSALEARPRLKDGVKIVRREIHGRIHFVVKEPIEQKYFQFGEMEVGLMRLMDGQRTPSDIAIAASETIGTRPPAGQVADFAQKLKRLGLVERTPVEQHLMLVERLRSDRKVRARRRTKGSILRLRFSIGDPDSLFESIVNRIRWVWSPRFVIASLALFGIYFVILFSNWNEFWGATFGLYTLSGFGVWDYVILYGLFFGIGSIHELGHGLTTKAFGGEVREIGGMVLYFSPALFCNTNDAWTFDSRSRRLWVTFAGPWIEMLVGAIAAIVWITTEPGTFIHTLAFLTFLSGGIMAVLANMNPLLPLDGYYALSDWLEIPNLRRRAFEYMAWVGKRYGMGMHVAEPGVTPRERRVFLAYGVAALMYSALFLALGIVWLIVVAGRILGPVVWLILLFGVAKAISGSAGRGRALATAATTTWRAGFLGGRRAAVLLASVALLIALPFLLPWTTRVKGEFHVEALPRALVRAEVGGTLDRWHISEGDTVTVGAPVATLWNPTLRAEHQAYEARVERLKLERAGAEAAGDLTAAASAGAVLEEAQRELAVLQARHDRLVVRAPIDGVVLGHRLQERLGLALDEGELLVEVASARHRRARVSIPPKRAGEVGEGQTVVLRLESRPELKFVTQVSAVAPAAEQGWLVADVLIPFGDWQPDPGMSGVAKIRTVRGTIAQAIARAVRRTIRIDLWL